MTDPKSAPEKHFSSHYLDLIFSQHNASEIEAVSIYLEKLEWGSEALYLGRTLAAYENQRGWRTQAEDRYRGMLNTATEVMDKILLYLDLAALAERWHDHELFTSSLDTTGSYLATVSSSPAASPHTIQQTSLVPARFLHLKALLATSQFKLEEAFPLAEEALGLYREHNDREGVATILNELCYFYGLAAKFEEALTYTLPLVESGLEHYNLKLQSDILANHGYVLRRVKGNETVLPFYEKWLELATIRRDPLSAASAMASLGALYGSLNRPYNEEEELYQEGLRGLEEVGAMSESGALLNNQATLYIRHGKYDEALINLHRSLELATSRRNFQKQAITTANIADVYFRQGDIRSAAEWCKRSYQFFRQAQREDRAFEVIYQLVIYFTELDEAFQTELVAEFGTFGDKTINMLLEKVRTIGERFEKDITTRNHMDILKNSLKRRGVPVSLHANRFSEYPKGSPKRNYTDKLYRDLATLDQTARILAGIAQTNYYQQLVTALSDSSGTVREVVATALGKSGRQEAVLPLIETLSFEERNTRCQVYIEALAELGDERAAEEIVRTITRHKTFEVTSTVRTLKKLGEGAFEPLLKALNHPDPTVQEDVVFVLGHLGDRRAVESLATLLENEPGGGNGKGFSDKIFQRAIVSLGYIKDTSAIVALAPLLRNEEPAVREATIDAISRIGTAAALPSLLNLLKTLAPTSVWTTNKRYKIISALADLGELAFTPLLEILSDQTFASDVRESTAKALSRIKVKELRVQPPATTTTTAIVTTRLQALLADPSTTIRACVAGLLVKLNVITAFEALVPLLRDPAGEVRDQAIVSLGILGDGRAVPLLLEILKEEVAKDQNVPGNEKDEEGNEIYHNIACALGELKDRRAVPLLLAILKEKVQSKNCSAVIMALGKLGDPQAFEPLVELLDHTDLYSDEYVNQGEVAVEALGYLGDWRAVETLVKVMTKQKNSIMRENAVKALGRLGERTVNSMETQAQANLEIIVATLIQTVVEDHSSFVRKLAAEQLGKIGASSEKSIKALLVALEDPEQLFVRVAAAEALGKVGNASAIPALMRLKKVVAGAWTPAQQEAISVVETAIQGVEGKYKS